MTVNVLHRRHHATNCGNVECASDYGSALVDPYFWEAGCTLNARGIHLATLLISRDRQSVDPSAYAFEHVQMTRQLMATSTMPIRFTIAIWSGANVGYARSSMRR